MRVATIRIRTGCNAGMSVAFTIDVSRNDANPKMKLSAKHTPAGNAASTRRRVRRPPIRYANGTAIAVPMVTRQSTMVGAEASMPFTKRGPNPHANTASDTASNGSPARWCCLVTA